MRGSDPFHPSRFVRRRGLSYLDGGCMHSEIPRGIYVAADRDGVKSIGVAEQRFRRAIICRGGNVYVPADYEIADALFVRFECSRRVIVVARNGQVLLDCEGGIGDFYHDIFTVNFVARNNGGIGQTLNRHSRGRVDCVF